MSEIQISYALTTVQRIKDKLGITEANNDTIIARMIAAATDFLEKECGGRRFLETTYSNEVYSIYHDTKYLALKNIPVSTVTGIRYRPGTKSNPNWTSFNTDDWELVNDGASGLIKIYGLIVGTNTTDVSYTAGYKIDFSNAGSPTAHNLPVELSELCERLVIKMFKRRADEGKQSETFEGTTVTWGDLLDQMDKDIIAHYRRLPEFI